MIFSSLSKKENKAPGELWALIDIQSGLVRGSIVLLSPKGIQSRVIYTIQHALPHKSEMNSGYITKTMLHGVAEVAALLARDGMQRVRGLDLGRDFRPELCGIHYILSSPWVMSQTKRVKVSYGKPTAISRSSVAAIIDKAREELEAGMKDFDATLIEQKIFEVKLNGYSVTEYEGKTANDLDVSCALSISSKKMLQRISNEVQRYLHAKQEHHHSALLLEYAGLRAILHQHNEYMVIHAHSELTDVVVVKNNMCVFISSFPFGIATIIRKMAKTLRQSMPAADSLLTLFDGGKLSDEERARISPIINEIGKGWVHDLFATLAHAGETMVIPRNIILSAHSHFSFFAIELNSPPSAPEYKPNIAALELPMIADFITYDPGQERSLRIGIYTTALASLE
ncbi:MAG: hypothetical protein JWO73_742 [Candidatus Taylorbacteria bacterium]|nr:hypothetical protein [Candidatus Taylorbacteria bacterium]